MPPLNINLLYTTASKSLWDSQTHFINQEPAPAREHLQKVSECVAKLLDYWNTLLVEQDEKDSTAGHLRLQLSGLQNWLKNESDPTRRCIVASRIEEVKQELGRIETL